MPPSASASAVGCSIGENTTLEGAGVEDFCVVGAGLVADVATGGVVVLGVEVVVDVGVIAGVGFVVAGGVVGFVVVVTGGVVGLGLVELVLAEGVFDLVGVFVVTT